MPYGAFIEIEDGIEGLIHVSEMSWTKRVTRASDVLMVGEEVEAIILDIQEKLKRFHLVFVRLKIILGKLLLRNTQLTLLLKVKFAILLLMVLSLKSKTISMV